MGHEEMKPANIFVERSLVFKILNCMGMYFSSIYN